MVIGNIVKPGKLTDHRYSQCYWKETTKENAIVFVSYNSPIFCAVEDEQGITFYPRPTTPRHSKSTAKHTLWALYTLGYSYKEAHNIIDGLCTKHIVKA